MTCVAELSEAKWIKQSKLSMLKPRGALAPDVEPPQSSQDHPSRWVRAREALQKLSVGYEALELPVHAWVTSLTWPPGPVDRDPGVNLVELWTNFRITTQETVPVNTGTKNVPVYKTRRHDPALFLQPGDVDTVLRNFRNSLAALQKLLGASLFPCEIVPNCFALKAAYGMTVSAGLLIRPNMTQLEATFRAVDTACRAQNAHHHLTILPGIPCLEPTVVVEPSLDDDPSLTSPWAFQEACQRCLEWSPWLPLLGNVTFDLVPEALGSSPFLSYPGLRHNSGRLSDNCKKKSSSGGWVGLRFFLKKGEHIFARPPALGEEHIPRRWGGAQPQRCECSGHWNQCPNCVSPRLRETCAMQFLLCDVHV